MVLAMLEGGEAPAEEYRLVTQNNFTVNPLVNPRSYYYVVDAQLLHPLVATDRTINLLRSKLQEVFEQAAMAFRREAGELEVVEAKFKENLHVSIPSEKRGAKPLRVERVCTTRPPPPHPGYCDGAG
jgi:hypothetical protein